MWPSSYLSLLFALSLVIGLGKADISDIFNLLQGEGACGSVVDTLDDILQDVQTLADGFRQAITVAETQPTTQDGKVARQLLESWLGVKVDEDGVIDDDVDAALFQQVGDISERLDDFLADEGFTAPVTPPNLICDGTGFVKYEWDADLLRWDQTATPPGYAPVMAGDEAVRLSEVYAQTSENAPYLFDELHTYFSFKATNADRNVCQNTDGASLNGVTVAGRMAIDKAIRGESFEEDSVAPLMVMCPATTAHTGRLAAAASTEALKVVGTTTLIDLSDAVVAPATLFHEMIHLVSYWDEDDQGDIVGDSHFVTDFSYNPVDMISWNYAVRDYTENGQYPRAKSAYNAESYTFFALSWWWYVQARQTTYYMPILQDWNFDVNNWLAEWDAAFAESQQDQGSTGDEASDGTGDSDGTGELDDDSYVGSGSEARKRWLRRALRSGRRSEVPS